MRKARVRSARGSFGCPPAVEAPGLRALYVKRGVGVTLHDESGRVSVASVEAGRLLGVDRVELVGRLSLFAGETAIAEPAARALETGRAQAARLFAVTGSNQTRWFKVTAEPLFKVGATVPYAAVTRFESVRRS